MRLTLAALLVAGLAGSSAMAQDTAGVGSPAATRSPSTTPADVRPGTGAPTPATPGILVPQTGATERVMPRIGTPATSINRVDDGAPVAQTLDRLFAAAAAAGGMAEVAASRIAAEKGACDEVRLFAQKMITDHTKANNELKALAASKLYALPIAGDSRDRADQAILGMLSGEEFDKAYIKNQLAGHICAVALFEAEADRGTDPETKAWAAKMLPTLKEHEQQAIRMHKEAEHQDSKTKSGS